MLTDINLLPQQEKPSPALLYLMIALIIIGLLGTSAVFYYYYTLGNQKTHLSQELETTVKIREVKQVNFDQGASSVGAINELSTLNKSLKTLALPSVQILDSLAALLPANGFFRTYSLVGENKLELNMEFTSLKDAAGYLNLLVYLEWISKAEMKNITESEGKYHAQFTIMLNRAYFISEKEGQE